MAALHSRAVFAAAFLALVGYGCLISLSTRNDVAELLSGTQPCVDDSATNVTRRQRRPFDLPSATTTVPASGNSVLAERQRLLTAGCRWLVARGRRLRALRPEFARTFNVPSLRLTYCATPKCGTTTWFNFFERATGNACLRKGSAASIHSCARIKFDSPSTAAGFLSNSLVVVRDPWRRLVSAYEDKFVRERHVLAAACYRRRGKPLHGPAAVTFSEFVRCVLEDYRGGRELNPHYAPLHWQCSMCKIQYGYIAKLETIADDFRYLATYVFPDRSYQRYSPIFSSVRRRPAEVKNVTSIAYDDCYRSLAPDTMAALVSLYRPDAVLLGYPDTPLP